MAVSGQSTAERHFFDEDGTLGSPRIEDAISRATNYFLSLQADKGYWVFDLEADVTIPSEYIFLQYFLGREILPELKDGIFNYLLNKQLENGGWALYEGGEADISASVKAYFALKMLGASSDEPFMIRARKLILSLGGAARVNVFTRTTLAMFGQIPWNTVPCMPIEIMMLPKWFFFHLYKISYWSRTVLVPLLIIYHKKPVCHIPDHMGIRELFIDPPETLKYLDKFVSGNFRKNLFILLDRMLRPVDSMMPVYWRKKALRAALKWTREHMQGEGGIGAIFPAMANAVMALKILGYPEDDPDYMRGIKALDDLVVMRDTDAFCQPCNSPIWDSCLSLSALLEGGLSSDHPSVVKCRDWLLKQQVFTKGDWSVNAPDLEPGGWAFQFENALYVDIDDTPMVLMSLFRAGTLNSVEHRENIAKAVRWIIGMQSSDGGWGAFDIDNNYLYLNDIPFADHGALLDPSTSDVTARCVEMLRMLGFDRNFPPVRRALKFLRKEQESFGAWYGRWGVNYIYGTWSVLMALNQVGEDMTKPYIRRAVEWLNSCQNPDGGWGESCYSYADPSWAGKGPSTASQTAWALLALMAAGEVDSLAVRRGIHYLLKTQRTDGGWEEPYYTGTGFPRVFYLRYHGYCQYFPLWALGVFNRLVSSGKTLESEVACKQPPDFLTNG